MPARMAGLAARPPLEIALRPSRLLIVALALGHALALAAPWLGGLPPWLAVISSAAVVLSAAWQLRQWRRGARRLRWQAGALRLEFASGRVLEGAAQPGWVLPGFITLDVLPGGGGRPYSLLLLADSASAEALRQLRAALRHPSRKEMPGSGAP